MSKAWLRVRQDGGGSDREWGALVSDYIRKREGACARCSQRRDRCTYSDYICEADGEIKYAYKHGRTKKAMDQLRGLPSELLCDYLNEEHRTPTELKAVILDELQQREKEDTPRL